MEGLAVQRGQGAVFSSDVMRDMVHWLSVFRIEWYQEVPQRLHSRDIDDGGAPQWHPEFLYWLTRNKHSQQRNPAGRLRVTQAMRSLRKVAPRQYEVLYRIMVLNDSVEATTQWLNERAIRHGHPERYRKGDTLAILQAGVDWVSHHY